jgi:hypothetical protein
MGLGRRSIWLDRGLSLVTAAAVLAALYVVARERAMPARGAEALRPREGDKLVASLALESYARSDRPFEAERVRVPNGRQILLLVYASTCPACYANLPAWRRVILANGGATDVIAVGFEADPAASRAYAERHLPVVTHLAPTEPPAFAAALGLDKVPFTALISADGRFRIVRRGALDAAAESSLVRALRGPAGSRVSPKPQSPKER